jgi:hypothetical protein
MVCEEHSVFAPRKPLVMTYEGYKKRKQFLSISQMYSFSTSLSIAFLLLSVSVGPSWAAGSTFGHFLPPKKDVLRRR